MNWPINGKLFPRLFFFGDLFFFSKNHGLGSRFWPTTWGVSLLFTPEVGCLHRIGINHSQMGGLLFVFPPSTTCINSLSLLFLGATQMFCVVSVGCQMSVYSMVRFICLVVWNMNFMTFHSIGNVIILTDKLHHFSVETSNQLLLMRFLGHIPKRLNIAVPGFQSA